MLGPGMQSGGLTKVGIYFEHQIHLAAGSGACQHWSRGQGGCNGAAAEMGVYFENTGTDVCKINAHPQQLSHIRTPSPRAQCWPPKL
eukprot:11212068-Lingulodinium_polyedra.AAC.1